MPLCANCSAAVARGRKYCPAEACAAVARTNRSLGTAAANAARWAAWKAAGIDPTHGGEAGEKRGAAIAASNREKPRRKKKTAKRVAQTAADRKKKWTDAALRGEKESK